jgi:probable addiction module antidote protein
MAKRSTPFDVSEHLDDDEMIAEYITEALLSNDLETVTRAIGAAAKARGMTRIAEEAGVSRESLYRALSGDGNPQFDTIARVLTALGLRLRVEPVEPDRHAA